MLVYDGKLEPGWQDWGWGKHDLSQGAARIDLSQHGGWILRNAELAGPFEALVFQMRAPGSFGTFLRVRMALKKDKESFPAVEISPGRLVPLADGWVQVAIPWSTLNPKGAPVDRVILHAQEAVNPEMVEFDKIAFTRFDAKAALAKAPVERLVIDCKAKGHRISPYIYGAAGSGDFGSTIVRWGGNRTTRYNWRAKALNVGKDWFFENTEGGDSLEWIAGNRENKLQGALTVPTIGWVAKDTSSYGFPVSVLGPQQRTDRHRKDAGNGVRPDGTQIVPGPPTQTSVPAPPSMIREWIEAIRADEQKHGSRGVHMYFLDNEPMLWKVTHRDVHPDPVGYDELLDRTIRYGTVLREADPNGLIAGPTLWGWTAYFYSAQDTAKGVNERPDRRAHGDMPLLPWYLKKLREHEQTTGKRVLDVLDVHYYPQAQRVYSKAADPKTAALRLRSTRSLWDPDYTDESWIKEPVRLIPRLKEWVAEYYPGLKVSLGEYNFGAEEDISGALAQAEALGRFGTEAIDYAFYWVVPPEESPVFWAFRAFRNFDGKGARFLDWSLPTSMRPQLSLFASTDATRKRVVAIAINLDPNLAVKTKIELSGCAPLASRQRFGYNRATPAIEDQGVRTGGDLEETFPPYSITIMDLTLR
jgi:hypothetical protein